MCLSCSGCPNLTKKRTELSGEVMLVKAEFIFWSHLSIHVGWASTGATFCRNSQNLTWLDKDDSMDIIVSVCGWVSQCVCCSCSVTQSCLILWGPMDCSTPGFPVLYSLGVCSNSCPLSRWCHPTISSPVTHFYSCPQTFPASESFPVSWLFASSGLSIYWSFSFSISPSNEYSRLISFRTD